METIKKDLTHLSLLLSFVEMGRVYNRQALNIEGMEAISFSQLNGAGCTLAANEKEALVFLQGSNDFVDFFLNAMYFKAPYYSDGAVRGKVHYGFFVAWNIIRHQALKTIREMDPSRKKSYTVVGHSLGGALAIFLADDLFEAGYRVEKCLTAGCPRVGNAAFSRWIESRVPTTRYVNEYDLVTTLPPPFTYTHVGVPQYIHKGQIQSRWGYRSNLLKYLLRGVPDHRLSSYIENLSILLENK